MSLRRATAGKGPVVSRSSKKKKPRADGGARYITGDRAGSAARTVTAMLYQSGPPNKRAAVKPIVERPHAAAPEILQYFANWGL